MNCDLKIKYNLLIGILLTAIIFLLLKKNLPKPILIYIYLQENANKLKFRKLLLILVKVL